jgi:hypothetical protein
MKMRMRRLLVLGTLAMLATAGCASSHDQTWIGKNVGVAVQSPAPQQPAAVAR